MLKQPGRIDGAQFGDDRGVDEIVNRRRHRDGRRVQNPIERGAGELLGRAEADCINVICLTGLAASCPASSAE